MLDAFGSGSGVPHIVVDKVVNCKLDDETGEASYCVKWQNNWIPEGIMSCMFPDLLATFQKTDKYENFLQQQQQNLSDLQPELEEDPIIETFMLPDVQLTDALNLMELSTPIVTDKSHDTFEALDLFSTDIEFSEMLQWRFQKETKHEDGRKAKGDVATTPTKDNNSTYIGRSKRIRKPTAKKLASEENENKILNSPPKVKHLFSNSHKKRGRPAVVEKKIYGNEPVQCDICGKVVRKKRLENHRILHSNNRKHACETCGKICGTRSDLQNHMLIHGEFNYECEQCGQRFKQPAPYRIHMRTHTVEMNWMCDVCFQNFKFQGELKKHCNEDHADICKNPQRCCICKEMLKSPNSVYRHSVGHTGVRSFECGVCGKKFKHKGHLEKHLLMHERLERKKTEPPPTGPFQCEVCGKEFPYLQSIKIHLGKHKANQENNLEEYLQKKASRQATSKERYRQNAKAYKAKYKEMQIQKSRILKELGIEPDNPIAKTIDFKSLMKNMEETADEVELQEAVLQEDGNVVEVETNIVEDNVVIGAQIESAKAVEYVVSEGSTVVVEDGAEVTEISMEDLDSGFALLNFLRHGKN